MKSVFVFTNEDLIADLLERRLSGEDYEAVIGNDPQKALAIVIREKVSLIILDLDLPNLAAFAFLTKKRNDPSLKSIPVIVLSNAGQIGELSRAKKLGATDWALKTEFDPEEIIQKVKNIFKSIKASS